MTQITVNSCANQLPACKVQFFSVVLSAEQYQWLMLQGKVDWKDNWREREKY